jgi:hypothetical protein
MATELKDYWQDFTIEVLPTTPLGLLKYQASMLSPRTNGLLEGESSTYTEQGAIYNTLDIVAPRLDHYRYTLIQIVSGPAQYPIFVYDRSGVDYTPLDVPVKFPNVTVPKLPNASFVVRNYEDFEKAVEEILSSKETANIIRSLMNQSKEVNPLLDEVLF